MTINVYWSRSIPDTHGAYTHDFISPLRYYPPEPLHKHLNYKEFFGPHVSRCPAVVDELKNTFVIKSPVDITMEFTDGGFRCENQSVSFAQTFFGLPQGTDGLHQMGMGYLMFAEQSLMLTQLPAYYDVNGYTEATVGVSASFDCGRWFRSSCKPTFKLKPGQRRIEIKEGDALAYVKFNTTERINMIEIEDSVLDQMHHKHYVTACVTLKHQATSVISLQKCYEYFDRFKLKDKILKAIKGHEIK